MTTTGIYHSCLLPVLLPVFTMVVYYQYIVPVTNTGIYYQCLLPVANIGDDDRYIPFLSITSTYHQWPLLVYTTGIYTTGIYYIYHQSTGIYYGYLLPVNTTGGHYRYILLCLLPVTTINDYYWYILPTALYTTSIYYLPVCKPYTIG